MRSVRATPLAASRFHRPHSWLPPLLAAPPLEASFLEASLDQLRPGGIYVVEDIGWEDIERWYERLETVYSKQYPTHEFAFVVLAKHDDGNMLFIRRPEGEAVFSGPAVTGAFREAE